MILVCTLGTSWAVVPEAWSFLAPDVAALFANHPTLPRFREDAVTHGFTAPNEIWIVTTDGHETDSSLAPLRRWIALLPVRLRLRVFRAQGSPEAGDESECRLLRELIFRVVLQASEADPGLVLSLAGGRKTMSADLQSAGQVFGCRALVHVLTSTPPPNELKSPSPEAMAAPLPPAVARLITPLVVGRGARADFLDLTSDRTGPVRASEFPVSGSGPSEDVLFRPQAGERLLTEEIDARQREAARLMGNFLQQLSSSERHENWRGLYRLRPADIEKLRDTTVDETQLDILRRLPKADLHHHLGGCLSIEAQQEVGRAVWGALPLAERDRAQDAVSHLLRLGGAWTQRWNRVLRQPHIAPEERAARAAALLVNLDAKALERGLYGPTEPRRALKHRGREGFRLYELPGELSGSALLGHEAAVEEYARQCRRQATAQGIRYLELRGSPTKYLGGDGRRFLRLLRDGLRLDAPGAPPCDIRFLVIADRRQPHGVASAVTLALETRKLLDGFVVGVDLAGDERRGSPATLARRFASAFAACLPVTIHAGEGEDAGNIWEAAYRLHADRIGHGLTLADKQELAPRFRDRRICLELCPSSNLEVVGYRDPADPETEHLPPYPLARLLELGLPLTLCTDNPGISRTDLAHEYVVASRIGGGLSLWEALAIVKQGFLASFLPADERERLTKEVDGTLYRLLSDPCPDLPGAPASTT